MVGGVNMKTRNSLKIEIYINNSAYAHKIEYGRGKI